MDFDDFYMADPLIEGEDYYMNPKGFRVMSKSYLTKRGYCCGNGCKHCPYFPPHQKGNRELKE